MTQVSREQYESDAMTVMTANTHVTEQKTNQLLLIVISVLLDIREKLFNPDLKA